jgi:hypothetical protein
MSRDGHNVDFLRYVMLTVALREEKWRAVATTTPEERETLSLGK